MSKQQPTADSRGALLTVNDVARLTKVHRTTVYRAVARHELPIVRFGRQLRVRPRDLVEYLERSAAP